MKLLIVNADDFGYTRGVNRAILLAYRSGIVTSASLLANGSAFQDAAEAASLEPGLDVGCHLNLVEGHPVLPSRLIPHLVGSDGKFFGLARLAPRLLGGAVPAVEIERECSAQIERLLAAGVEPGHVDTHQHLHLVPRVADAVARTARRFDIGWIRCPFENYTPPGLAGVRWRKALGWSLKSFAPRFRQRMGTLGLRVPDFFTGVVVTGRLTSQTLAQTLRALPTGVTEIMCHPGYWDSELEASPTRLQRQREVELETLADGTWRETIRRQGILLTGFRGAASARETAAENPRAAVAIPVGRE